MLPCGKHYSQLLLISSYTLTCMPPLRGVQALQGSASLVARLLVVCAALPEPAQAGLLARTSKELAAAYMRPYVPAYHVARHLVMAHQLLETVLSVVRRYALLRACASRVCQMTPMDSLRSCT